MEPLVISRDSIPNKVFGGLFVLAALCGAIAVPTPEGRIMLGLTVGVIGTIVLIQRRVTIDPQRELVEFTTSLFGLPGIYSQVRGFHEFAAVASAKRYNRDDGAMDRRVDRAHGRRDRSCKWINHVHKAAGRESALTAPQDCHAHEVAGHRHCGQGRINGEIGSIAFGYNQSYTRCMKTAVSIPDKLFRRADRLAKDLGISRSQLYARAVEEFVRARSQADVTAQLNRFFDDHPELNKSDPVLQALQSRSLNKARRRAAG